MTPVYKWAAAAIALIALFLALPDIFQPQSINSILSWIPLILLLALGQMIVVISGGIDVSIGSTLGLTAMVLGTVVSKNLDMPVPLQFLLCLGVGAGLGCFNGCLIAFAKIQPLVATIATLATFRGLAFIVNESSTITGSMLPPSLLDLSGNGIQIGSITAPWLLIFALNIAALFGFALKFTNQGREIFTYGSDQQGAFRRGVSEPKTLLVVYGLCGAMAGLAGGFYASRFGLVHPGTAGFGWELTAIAAVVIGGVKLSGGVGSVGGVIASCLFLAVLNVALSVARIGADWQLFTYGLVLLIALATDRKKKSSLEVARA